MPSISWSASLLCAIAALRAKQLRRGARPRIEQTIDHHPTPHKAERVAMEEVRRGLVNYDADELRRIRGAKTADIERTLGYKGVDEVVHRDNLVIL